MVNIYDAPIYDERCRSSGIISYVDQKGLPYRVEVLLIGDVAVSDRIVIEIKRVTSTTNDLRASLFDDRVHQQSQDRKENYEVNIIILEIDDENNLFDAFFTKQHLLTLMDTLEYSFNTHIHITHSMEETVNLIYHIWEVEKKGPKYVSPCNKNPRPKTLREQQLYFLSGLLDVGDKKAVELLDRFKSPSNVLNWICDQDLDVKGFGPKFFEKNKRLLIDEDEEAPSPIPEEKR